MIGYHYTTWENWEKIREEGLIPYEIRKPELLEYFPNYPIAIFVWEKKLKGQEHIGSVLYQATMKKCMRIVELEIRYTKEDMLTHTDPVFKWKRNVKLWHRGKIGQWKYHNKVPSILVGNTILPENIRLVGDYDLNMLIR